MESLKGGLLSFILLAGLPFCQAQEFSYGESPVVQITKDIKAELQLQELESQVLELKLACQKLEERAKDADIHLARLEKSCDELLRVVRERLK